MQLINNKLIFSATDLTEFVECSFSTALNYLKLKGDISYKKKDLNIALRKSADDHEKKYLNLLEKKNTRLIKISNFDNFDNKVSLTIESLKNLSNIYQAYLSKGNWAGIPDFIELNKDNEFQIVDAKFSNDTKTSYILHLSFTLNMKPVIAFLGIVLKT